MYRKIKIVLITLLAIYFAVGMIFAKYYYYQRERRIGEIVDGEVRGNEASLIYHLAPCPNYNSISPENLRIFKSSDEAEEAEYIFTNNCDDIVLSIRKANEEYPGGSPY